LKGGNGIYTEIAEGAEFTEKGSKEEDLNPSDRVGTSSGLS
jgi:hypothetical protein